MNLCIFWLLEKGGFRALAHRLVLSPFPNTLPGPFWRYQSFRDEVSKDEIRPAGAVHSLHATALKPAQPEVRKCQNVWFFSSVLIPAYHGGGPVRLLGANSTSQVVSPPLSWPQVQWRCWGHPWLQWCSWRGMVHWKGIQVLSLCYEVQDTKYPVDFDTAWECSVQLKSRNRGRCTALNKNSNVWIWDFWKASIHNLGIFNLSKLLKKFIACALHHHRTAKLKALSNST